MLGLVGSAVWSLSGCVTGVFSRSTDADQPTATGDCPDLPDAERTVCPGDDGPVGIDRSATTVDGTAWSLRVAVANRGESPVQCSPAGWSVLRSSAGGWTAAVAGLRRSPRVAIAPGERYVWSLATPAASTGAADRRLRLALDPGEYAFSIPLRAGEPLAAVAPFTVAG
ncbi:MAG: hypothetical protein ABEJ92_06195 [Halobacteriales archaeon]